MNKNKFIKALLACLAAFMLYSANLHRVENAKIKIIEPKTQQKKKQQKEPQITTKNLPNNSQVKETEKASAVKSEKGSQKSLVQTITKAMGSKAVYQVAVQDLNNTNRYARVATSSKKRSGSKTMQLYLLVALYKQEQSGKLGSKTNIKIVKSDQVKGEKYLTTNMMYGIQYLRQAMMRGSKTARNALVRKVGLKNINQVAKSFGAKNTTIKQDLSGTTTADDLDNVLKGLYQGRVLKKAYAQRVLTAMHGQKIALTQNISGTIYSIGDSKNAAAIIQTTGHSYTIAVLSNSNQLATLGKNVNTWISKH